MRPLTASIVRRRIQALVAVLSDGPIMMARLAPGGYTVRATAGGKTIERKVHIAPGESVRAVFVWPQRPGVEVG